MRTSLIVVGFLLFTSGLVHSQKVDSIKVEQTGDLVKVYYKILNSSSSQLYRVSVLCSINGGLQSVLNSLSGDYGDNVPGGRDEYMVLWDVLKDVEELKSAEFFIKAELIRDLAQNTEDVFDTTRFWSAKRIILLPQIDFPGPGFGLRIGYLGNWGISVHAYRGPIPVLDEYKTNQYYPGEEVSHGLGIDLTKRIISKNSIQVHLLAGFRNNDAMVYFSGPPSPEFWSHGVEGFEFGSIVAYRRLVVSLMYSHYSKEMLEAKHDSPVTPVSPDDFFNFGIGMRF